MTRRCNARVKIAGGMRDGGYLECKISRARNTTSAEKKRGNVIAFEMKMKRIQIKRVRSVGEIVWRCGESPWGSTKKVSIAGHIPQKHDWEIEGWLNVHTAQEHIIT